MIRDEKGNRYPTLKAACRILGITDDGGLYARMRAFGVARKGGHTFTKEADDGQSPMQGDDVLSRLQAIYKPEELEKILTGEGLARPVEYPRIELTGGHHRIAVISDTHIGSRFAPHEWHDIVAGKIRELECECLLHCGDLVEGMRIARIGSQMYELTDLGFEAQRDRAVELMKRYELPIYVISGNHDAFFKEYAGADIVRAVADRVDGMEYLGYDKADIVMDGVVLRLWHGGDGNAYALSYRLQKVIESLTGGQKPAILLAGHVHKFCYIFERNIHAISCPCMQMQTDWMSGRKMAAHTGFLVLDFDVKDGCVCNLSVRLFPFYA